MDILHSAVAGTMESSDIQVTIEPCKNGVEIDLTSAVEKQFGEAIRKVIGDTLSELQVKAAKIIAVDKGALDCAIRARVKTAVYRASQEGTSLHGEGGGAFTARGGGYTWQ